MTWNPKNQPTNQCLRQPKRPTNQPMPSATKKPTNQPIPSATLKPTNAFGNQKYVNHNRENYERVCNVGVRRDNALLENVGEEDGSLDETLQAMMGPYTTQQGEITD
eukprot:gene17404-763_t